VRLAAPERIPAKIRPQPGILATLRDIDDRLTNIEAHLGIRKFSALAGADPEATESPEDSPPGPEASGAEDEAGGSLTPGGEDVPGQE
jgi:hypothetical protein